MTTKNKINDDLLSLPELTETFLVEMTIYYEFVRRNEQTILEFKSFRENLLSNVKKFHDGKSTRNTKRTHTTRRAE